MARRRQSRGRYPAPHRTRNRFRTVIRQRSAGSRKRGAVNTGRVVARAAAAGAGAAALAMYDDHQAEAGKPAGIAGIDSGLVLGTALALVGPMVLTGRAGRLIGEAGIGAFAVGVNRSVHAKTIKVGEDDDEYA